MKKINFERGQSLVELAISLVVLLWLLAGAVEFGLAFFQFIQLRDAAQEGALYGSINPPASASPSDTNRIAIEARVRAQSSSPVDLTDITNVTVVTTSSPATPCIGDTITVTVTYNHVIFMPFANLFMDSTILINSEVTDVVLNSSC